jgi:hypothetical protein
MRGRLMARMVRFSDILQARVKEVSRTSVRLGCGVTSFLPPGKHKPTKADWRTCRADLAGDAADFKIGVS